MTFLAPTGTQWRTPELGKNVIVSSWRGITRVQAWPKKRGLPKTKPERTRLEIFKLFQRLIKQLGPHETEYERQAIKNHNRTHRGQRGSAAIRFRDWQTQRLYGRTVAITTPEGITFWPPAVARDASFILDHVTDQDGQILQNAGPEWGPIDHGLEGQVLTAQGPGQPNAWQDW